MMVLDYDGLQRQILEQWLNSTPRQSGKSWAQEMYEQQCMRQAGIDYAKPGSDRTVVFPIYSGIKAEFYRLKTEMDRVAVCPPSILVTKEEAAKLMPALPSAPKQSENDRIWDLIVLAAESSRYG